MASAKREQMLKWVQDDLVSLRNEKCATLVHSRSSRLAGYINCMWHKDDLSKAEWHALREMVDNAEMYALRECLY